MTEHTLITPRRNFLIKALGFTVAGATVPISIITADDAKARIAHHQRELERAWRDYYGPAAGRDLGDEFAVPVVAQTGLNGGAVVSAELVEA